MTRTESERDLHKRQEEERNRCTRKVIESRARKKVVISGPGTGKTYLFSEIVKRQSGKCLVLTFINNLAQKLARDLGDRARCCTFHSYCKSLLHRIRCKGIDNDFVLYPKLASIICSDASTLLGQDLRFKHCFVRLETDSQELEFFIERSNFYNAVSFDDSVYRVLEHYEENPRDTPAYGQILVDEYQDFNAVEVAFIDVLAERSPVLIVGDDDQALYGQLKDASPEYIRMKYDDGEYEHFDLPFCSRCTQVVTDAIDDIIISAKRRRKLRNRVDRDYVCFLPSKLEDTLKYPKIVQVHCSIQTTTYPYIARFVEQEIAQLTPEEIEEANKEADCTVLVTGPGQYLKQINSYLRARQHPWDIEYRKREGDFTPTPSLLEGYRILLHGDRFSNLGWRVLMEFSHKTIREAALKKAAAAKTRLYDCLPKRHLRRHELVLRSLKKLKDDAHLSQNEEKTLESAFGVSAYDLKPLLQEDLAPKNQDQEEEKDVRRLRIVLSSYVGCKGLSAGYVFGVGLNEGGLPKNNNNPRDIEISQFIVVLSRTVKRCYLISVGVFGGRRAGRRSVFLDWINPQRIEEKRVDRSHWSSD